MSILKKVLFVLMISLPAMAFGQSKLAHVNSQKLLDAMPEVKVANAKLDTLNKQYEAQLKELAAEYEKKATAFQSTNFASEAIRNTKLAELQQLQERAQAFQEEANNDFTKTRETLFAPIEQKLKEAIKVVAQEGGYTYVMDSTNPSLLYAAETQDITNLVLKKIGVK